MDYARVEGGIVLEIIAAFFRTEDMRPLAPPALVEGEEPDDAELHRRAEAQAAHDGYAVGEVPIEERFPPSVVATLVAIPEGLPVEQGWLYGADGFSEPPPYVPPAVTAAMAIAERDRLMALATAQIAPLQDAVDIDEATPAEIALLKKWKQYRVALNRVQDQAGFPEDVDWPIAPN